MVDLNYTVIAQIVNFLFLVWILKKFAYAPLLQMMEDRKAKIANDLGGAESAKAEAEKANAQAQATLANARIEAAAIVETARANAQAAVDKMMADAEAAKAAIVAQGQNDALVAKKKAMEEVRAQVVELSLLAASKIIEKKLGTASDKKLATELVAQMVK